MTDDLVAFLRTRLSEDARVAEAAAPGPWSETGRHSVGEGMVHSDTTGWAVVGSVSTGYGPNAPYANVSLNAAHIARFNPARVLAEVEVKRQLLTVHKHNLPGWCSTCDVPGDVRGNIHGCTTLRLLALAHAGHPDYHEEWRP